MTDAVTPAEIAAPDANALTTESEVESVAESSPAAEQTPSEKPEHREARGVQKRLDELTRNWRETERDRDHWRELALRNQTPQLKSEPAPVDDKPKTLADFEYDEGKFQAYIFEQAEKRSVEAAKRVLSAEKEQEAKSRRQASFSARVTEFAKTVEDYDAVVQNPRLPITPEMAEVIKDSDDGPALAYHLGKNPEIAEKIAQLPPIAAARELGKIEARLAYERDRAKEAKPAVSKAPPPPPKIEGADAAIDKDPDQMSTEEWRKWREKQLAKKRK